MDFARLGKPEDDSNRRRNGRLLLQEIHCSLGLVLDLSSSGMRVQTDVKPDLKEGQAFGMVLQGLSGPVNVAATVAWIRKTGWRKFQLGIHFTDPQPDLRKAIAELARSVASNEVVRPDIEHYRRNVS